MEPCAHAILIKTCWLLLQAQITCATVPPDIGPFAFEALALIAELSSASWDACGYIASKRALHSIPYNASNVQEAFEDAVPHGNPASRPLQTCWPYMLDVAESAQLVLANASSGALAQRDAIVRVHGTQFCDYCPPSFRQIERRPLLHDFL